MKNLYLPDVMFHTFQVLCIPLLFCIGCAEVHDKPQTQEVRGTVVSHQHELGREHIVVTINLEDNMTLTACTNQTLPIVDGESVVITLQKCQNYSCTHIWHVRSYETLEEFKERRYQEIKATPTTEE